MVRTKIIFWSRRRQQKRRSGSEVLVNLRLEVPREPEILSQLLPYEEALLVL